MKPLKQKGLLTLSDYIIDEDIIHLVRPRYNRGNLIQALFLVNIFKLTEQELRSGAYTIFTALSTIHKVGYLHGDVRP